MEKDGRLWNLGRLILQNEEELAPLLSEKAKEVLEKLRDNQSELNDLGECEVFVCGFRLGARHGRENALRHHRPHLVGYDD